MKVWFVDIAATDGYMCTEGPFVSKDYVMFSKGWTFSELQWREAHDSDEDDLRFYAEQTNGSVTTGYVLYEQYVEGT